MIHSLSRAVATLSLAVSTAFTLAGAGQAATVYTSKAAFLAATTGLTTVDFEGITPPDTFTTISKPTISGVAFSDNLFILNCATLSFFSSQCAPATSTVGFTTIAQRGVTGTITATLPSGITAVGVDLFRYSFGKQLTVSISTGDSQTFTFDGDKVFQFVGFTSTTPITFLSLFSADDGQRFDNLVYGQANSVTPPSPTGVPEPSTVAGLLLVGSLGLGLARRKS